MHRGGILVAPFAVVGAALPLGAAVAIRGRPQAGSRTRRWGRPALTVGPYEHTLIRFFDRALLHLGA